MFIPIERPLDTKVIQFYLQSCSLSVSRLSSCVNISLPCFINIRFQMFKKNVDYFSIIFFLYGPLASISLEWRRFPSSLRRRRQKHKKKKYTKKMRMKKKKVGGVDVGVGGGRYQRRARRKMTPPPALRMQIVCKSSVWSASMGGGGWWGGGKGVGWVCPCWTTDNGGRIRH